MVKNLKGDGFALVTGACGFTGSLVVKMLLDQGRKVIATDLPGAFDHPKIKFIFKHRCIDFSRPGCQVVPSDLTDKSSLKALFRQPVTHVFHTASLYDYSAPMSLLKKINIDGMNNLLETVMKHSQLERFVHWSTCGVFGKPHTAKEGNCNIPFNEDYCSSPKTTPIEKDEPDGTHLVNDYSVTKFKQEQIAWKYSREKGLPLTVVRPAPIYGAGSDYGHGGIIIAVNKGLLPVIPADSRNYMTTSVNVEDMAGFACWVAGQDSGLGEDYNVVDDSVISFHEFLHYIALLLGRRLYDIPLLKQKTLKPVMSAAAKVWLKMEENLGLKRVRVFEVGSANYLASSYWISNSKSKAAGYKYRYPDVKEGLRDTIDWFRRVGWLEKSYDPKGAWMEYMK